MTLPTETLAVADLAAPAEIIVDRWGIAHIYAASERDVFFVQGFNAARERLWQIDLWRKRGLGLLSASFGPDYVAQDRAARLFLYRGDMDVEWASYGPEAKARAEAFVAGINAWVGRVRAGEARAPVEFGLTQSAPDFWRVDDVARIRSHGLTRNVDGEVLRARVAAAGGLAADRLRRKIEPDHAMRVPEGLDPADIPADVLADYVLGTKDVAFRERGQGRPASEAARWAELAGDNAGHGSNNWAIAPSRTASGRPILANDPHRILGAPSVRYIVHLEAPGFAAAGAGEPQSPGVTIGHNGRIAFGITTFMVDQEDLYVYDLKPDDPTRYRYGEAWEAMEIVRERIEVKGEAAREETLAFTRHGPVLKSDPATGRAFALRTIWSEPGTGAYLGSARYLSAGDWDAFRAALAPWRAASMNFVYADVHGDIGWIPAGLTPRRPNWDGLLPVPGDGRYEWRGFLAADELPMLHNPARGWVATANEMNLPAGYPNEARKVSFEWADPARARRIEAVLGANAASTIADSLALQTDVVSLTARRACALLDGLSSSDPGLADALGRLARWDGEEATDSVAAAIAEVWLNKHLAPLTAAGVMNPAAAAIVGLGQPHAVISHLEALGDDAAGERAAILLASLRTALDDLADTLGADMEAWTWGALHHAHFVPAAAALADPALRASMSHGPLPVPGSATTPRAATYRMDDFIATNGSSFRMVLDVGDWDGSRVMNSPGQSGDPDSPHYGDLFPLWAKGDYVPFLFTRSAIEAAAEARILLTPAA